MKKVVALTVVILVTALTGGIRLDEAIADDAALVSIYGQNISVPPSEAAPNSDGDAIADAADLCPGTLVGMPANMNGCSQGQSDPTGTPAALPRATSDRPDDITDTFQMHYVYLVPAGEIDQSRDTNGQVAQSIAAMQAWLTGQTARGWRLDTSGGYARGTLRLWGQH